MTWHNNNITHTTHHTAISTLTLDSGPRLHQIGGRNTIILGHHLSIFLISFPTHQWTHSTHFLASSSNGFLILKKIFKTKNKTTIKIENRIQGLANLTSTPVSVMYELRNKKLFLFKILEKVIVMYDYLICATARLTLTILQSENNHRNQSKLSLTTISVLSGICESKLHILMHIVTIFFREKTDYSALHAAYL